MHKGSKSCCTPFQEAKSLLSAYRKASAKRERARTGSTENMVRLDGGPFWMGTDSAEGFPDDGEGPVRKVTLESFYIDKTPVTNAAFAEFVRETGYQTESELFGWSFVFQGHIPPDEYPRLVVDTVLGAEWWCKVHGANWRHPEGPASDIRGREAYPVVHVSWNDAREYAAWAGKRL